jgi:hypothetical protein
MRGKRNPEVARAKQVLRWDTVSPLASGIMGAGYLSRLLRIHFLILNFLCAFARPRLRISAMDWGRKPDATSVQSACRQVTDPMAAVIGQHSWSWPLAFLCGLCALAREKDFGVFPGRLGLGTFSLCFSQRRKGAKEIQNHGLRNYRAPGEYRVRPSFSWRSGFGRANGQGR